MSSLGINQQEALPIEVAGIRCVILVTGRELGIV